MTRSRTQQGQNDNAKLNAQLMRLNTEKYKNRVIIFVEGKSDTLFFEKLLVESNIKFELSDGKENATKLIRSMKSKKHKYSNQAISICDADFNHLNNEKVDPLIFLTDTHDYETMILQDIGIKSLIAEHGHADFKETLNRNLLKNAIRLAYQIGLIKWFNSKNSQFNLNFKDKNKKPLDLSKFIQFKDFDGQFDQDKYIERVLPQSANNPQKKAKLLKDLKVLELEQADNYQVCNGHDITSIIALIISKYEIEKNKTVLPLKNTEPKHNFIESNLRMSYNTENFKTTNLYQQLKTWQTDNQMPKIVE